MLFAYALAHKYISVRAIFENASDYSQNCGLEAFICALAYAFGATTDSSEAPNMCTG